MLLPLAARCLLTLCILLSAAGAPAADLDINPDHPDRYVVVPGDTLWSISARFLNSPWQWPAVWRENQQIENPHYIYPGDVLVFREEGGAPRVSVETPSELRLSPTVRSTPLDTAVPAIPTKIIGPFLARPQVVDPNVMAAAPYVVDFVSEQIVAATDDRAYVRAILNASTRAFTIVRPGRIFYDRDTREVLGQEGIYVGDSLLEQIGDPATVSIVRSEQEVRIGDRLLNYRAEPLAVSFQPHAPNRPIRGHILDVLGGVTQIGQYSVVSIDRGRADGIEPGHVLAILQRGKRIRDTVFPTFGQDLYGQEQRAGLLMVFRSFERISFALVMHSVRFIHVDDIVETP